MFTHVMLGSNDLERSRRFYDATLGAIGHAASQSPPGADRHIYSRDSGTLVVGKPRNGEAATHANGGTVGFRAKDQAEVDAWHAAGLANGGSDEGAPGVRPMAGARYGAYLRDPDGHKLCCFAAG